jgi:leucyl-tRNA synthetase
MRDAIFARQRYWGEPIPLIHTKEGLIKEVSDKQLPLKLPNVKSYAPSGTGESPLATVSAWVKAGYETNTMPGWAGSSWYFLRYVDPNNKKSFAGEQELDYWFGKNGGVNMYVGGSEHATGHLLYSRFWHKFLKDLGYVKAEEPFQTLRNQGMIGGADGRKMSKRWGNVINPDDVVRDMGADTMRVYESFMGPFEAHLPWSTDGIVGSRRFIERIWRFQEKVSEKKTAVELEKVLHKTIKKVTADIADFGFNTAISAMMIFANELEKHNSINEKDWMKFLQILAPFAPHIADELWGSLGNKQSIHASQWPQFDPKKIIDDMVTIGVQINGKVRAEITIGINESEIAVKEKVVALPKIQEWLKGSPVKKFIYIPGKIINIVV